MKKIAFILAGTLILGATSQNYSQEEKQEQSQEKQKNNDVTLLQIIKEHPYLTAFIMIYIIDALAIRGHRAL